MICISLFIFESNKTYDLDVKPTVSEDPVAGIVIHGDQGAIIIPRNLFVPSKREHFLREAKREAVKFLKLLEKLKIRKDVGVDYTKLGFEIYNVNSLVSGISTYLFDFTDLLSRLSPYNTLHYSLRQGLYIKKANVILNNIIWYLYRASGMLVNLYEYRMLCSYLLDLGYSLNERNVSLDPSFAFPERVNVTLWRPWDLTFKKFPSQLTTILTYQWKGTPSSLSEIDEKLIAHRCVKYLDFFRALKGTICSHYRESKDKLKAHLDYLEDKLKENQVIYISDPSRFFENVLKDLIKRLNEVSQKYLLYTR